MQVYTEIHPAKAFVSHDSAQGCWIKGVRKRDTRSCALQSATYNLQQKSVCIKLHLHIHSFQKLVEMAVKDAK